MFATNFAIQLRLIVTVFLLGISALRPEPLNASELSLPKGIFALYKAGEEIPEQLYKHPHINGIVLREKWQAIEPSEGKYNWSYYDKELEKTAKYGKKASLLILSGGVSTPGWVFSQGAKTFQFKDTNKFHPTFQEKVSIPVFWDDLFIAKKTRLIREAGKRYTNHSALSLVSVSCANATTDDWNIPGSLNGGAIKFSEDKLVDVCKRLIDETMTAFPKQLVRMAIGAIPKKISSQPLYAVTKIVEYATKTYPGRFIIQRHNLSTKTPNPIGIDKNNAWSLFKTYLPYTAAQMLWPAVDVKSCRLNGFKEPCNPENVLLDAANKGIPYGLSYIEVYGADLLDKSLAQATEKIALSLQGRPGAIESKPLNPPATFNKANYQGQEDRRPFTKRRNLRQPSDPKQTWNGEERLRAPSGVLHETFDSKMLGKTVGYSIYLPKSYDKNTTRYPVVYWLHGKNGDEARGTHIAHYLQQAIDNKLIREAIMVFPNGGKESFYSDSFDGQLKIESMIINELIPAIDQKFRTLAERKGRVLEGFSMGGFGALKFACKYPEKFSSVVTFGGAFLDQVNQPKERDATAYQLMFNQDLSYFNKNTPAYWCERNAALVKQYNLKIRMAVGTRDGTRRYNERMHEVLNTLNIPHEYLTYDEVRHIPRQYYDYDQGGGFKFHEQVLSQ